MAKTRFTTNIVAKDSAKLNGSSEGGGSTEIPVATSSRLGGVKVGSGLSITEEGVLSAQGGGGASSYAELSNKPQINGVTLSGNKTTGDLGLGVGFNFGDQVANIYANTGELTINGKSGPGQSYSMIPPASYGSVGDVLKLTSQGPAWGTPSAGAAPKKISFQIGIMPGLGTGSDIDRTQYPEDPDQSDTHIEQLVSEEFRLGQNEYYFNSFIRLLDESSFTNVIADRFINLTSSDISKLQDILNKSVLSLKDIYTGTSFHVFKGQTEIYDYNDDYKIIPASTQIDANYGGLYVSGDNVYGKCQIGDIPFQTENPAKLSISFDSTARLGIIRIPLCITYPYDGSSVQGYSIRYDTMELEDYDLTNFSIDSVFVLRLEGYYFGESLS